MGHYKELSIISKEAAREDSFSTFVHKKTTSRRRMKSIAEIGHDTYQWVLGHYADGSPYRVMKHAEKRLELLYPELTINQRDQIMAEVDETIRYHNE